MTFFGTPRSSRKIEIDRDAVDANDPEVVKRLDRIANNYDKLDDILTQLESVMELDDRLASMDSGESNGESFRPKKPR